MIKIIIVKAYNKIDKVNLFNIDKKSYNFNNKSKIS